MNLVYISDIVLDTYPFGGCNSSLEVFSLGKIIITYPSEFLPGRFTYGPDLSGAAMVAKGRGVIFVVE